MNEELKKAREALKKIKWETDSCIKNEIIDALNAQKEKK